MSGSFTGFSEDDIRKLSDRNPVQSIKSHVKGITSNSGLVETALKTQKRAIHSTPRENKILKEKIKNSSIEPILESAKLNKTPQEPTASTVSNSNCDKSCLPAVIHDNSNPQAKILSSVQNFHLDTTPKSVNLSKTVETVGTLESTEAVKNAKEDEKEKETPLPERKLDLEEFQTRQKLIEEQNRKRKELLVKALAVKTKQTQEETQRLNEIREEFKKLDILLSNDVKILRHEIEIASLDYMEAQKRYFKIEKEFLEAKLVLHQRLERKEMLTEHLCAIIEKNEERKAEKLNELLSKLNLKADLQNDKKDELEESDNKKTERGVNLAVTNTDSKIENPES